MIAALRGKIIQKIPGLLVLDVAGVGYETLVPLCTYDVLPGLNEEVQLFVQTIVREDAITLYGFASEDEKKFFMLLIAVSGIGPKLALTLLGGLGVPGLHAAIANRDTGRLTAVPGVGKKTAERICVELTEKMGNLGALSSSAPPVGGRLAAQEAIPEADAASALVHLGYGEQQVWQVLRRLEKEQNGAELSVEQWLRLALRELAAG